MSFSVRSIYEFGRRRTCGTGTISTGIRAVVALALASAASPQRSVERAVQERAKQLSLDMSAADAEGRLRTLISEEVAQWHRDYERGRRPYDVADPDGVVDRAWRNLAGYGPLQPLLDDPDVWEIMINGPDLIFAKRHSGPSGYP